MAMIRPSKTGKERHVGPSEEPRQRWANLLGCPRRTCSSAGIVAQDSARQRKTARRRVVGRKQRVISDRQFWKLEVRNDASSGANAQNFRKLPERVHV